jgi:hypothetical protein
MPSLFQKTDFFSKAGTIDKIMKLQVWKRINEWLKSFIRQGESASKALRVEPEILKFVDASPSKPESFGYKITWLAVKNADVDAITAFLNNMNNPVHRTNWRAGIKGAYNGYCFVSMPIEGWVLVISRDIPDVSTPECRAFLAELSKLFGEVCFFANHRVSSYGAAAKFRDGKLLRGFSAADGEVFLNEGAPTTVEQKLMEDRRSRETDPDMLEWLDSSAGVFVLSDESAVTSIAGEWSIHPETLHERPESEPGFILRQIDTGKVRRALTENKGI